MDEGKRLVLTIEKPTLVGETLKLLSEAAMSDCRPPCGICMRLRDFAKQGCEALILNLRAVEGPVAGTSSGVRILGASLLGGVVAVSGQATNSWIVQLEELSRPGFLPMKLAARLGAFVHTLI